ncbi:hypothetical protein OAD39_00335 [Gammaproteobacteria bacterium]|jgi:hypothetical protein|nr:hypothetical protein [Gammaproteobacteria bacterium]|tara:strand:+ start:239 stop:1117 length:879 start_codon:yes stop_codon:yes gene_type:complete
MSKLNETRKKGTQTLIALAVIAIAVYFGFTPLYELITPNGGVAGAVVGSSFGAIFVIILTMYLLNKQTEIEQESKRGEKVFEEKMKIYWNIFENIQGMLEDGKISKDDEMQKLPFVMLKLIAIGDNTVIAAFQKVYDAINNVFNDQPTEDEVLINEDDRRSIMDLLGQFANECRVDLGVSDTKVLPKLFEDTQESIKLSGELMNIKNAPVNEPVSHEAKVSIAEGDFHIKRYETKHIRIYDDQNEICKSSKGILRKVNIEYNLGFIEDPDFTKKNTRAIGLEIIKKLNELGH